MGQAGLSQSRWWRGVLLVALCALAYYISFDHGRESMRPRLDDQERRFLEDQDRLIEKLARLEAQLARCLAAPAETDRTATGLGRIALKVNQSKTIFDGRLVLSVLALDSEAGRVLVQLNFVRENRQVTEELAVGGSLGFSLGGRDWAVVAAGLTLTTANLNLLEIKSGP
jgi:hypothetical protein